MRARTLESAGAVVAALLSLSPGALAESAPRDGERQVMGWAERTVLQPWGFRVQTRLDTGANTASIHARSIERFELGGEPWVRFELEVDPEEGVMDPDETASVTVELPVVRDVRIKQKEGEPDLRPVVPLVFCINGELHREEFSLKNREGFDYPLLLGRRFLGDRVLVDSNRRFLTEPDCPALSDSEEETSHANGRTPETGRGSG